MKSVSITLLSIFTFVGLSIAQPTLAKRVGESDEICILSIVPCPGECPTTCVYPNLPCPMTHQPKCPNKKKSHRGGHGNGRGHN